MNIGKFFVDTLHTLIFHQLSKFSEFDARKKILFYVEVFARKIKETTL